MPLLRNVCPLGDVDLPLIGRSLTAGEEFDVSDDVAALLVDQPNNYELVSPPADAPAPVTEEVA